jgi:spermidine/putrescine transport system substrate-binding protein
MWDEAYKGKITAQDNALARVGGTAVYLDDDPFNPTKWDEIRDALFEQKELIQKYWKDYQAGMEMFINEEAVVGQLTDGRTRMGAGLGGPMLWTVPEEGALVEVDTFAIPKVAKNPEGAHQFIDFLYRPENQLKLMTDMGTGRRRRLRYPGSRPCSADENGRALDRSPAFLVHHSAATAYPQSRLTQLRR